MSTSTSSRFTVWNKEPGLYSITNTSTTLVLDQENSDAGVDVQCCDGEPNLDISNPSQLWALVFAGKDEIVLINQRSGCYAAGPDASCTVVSQTGFPNLPATQWRVLPAQQDSSVDLIFQSVKNPSCCLELEQHVDGSRGVVKLGILGDAAAPEQIWSLKKQGELAYTVEGTSS